MSISIRIFVRNRPNFSPLIWKSCVIMRPPIFKRVLRQDQFLLGKCLPKIQPSVRTRLIMTASTRAHTWSRILLIYASLPPLSRNSCSSSSQGFGSQRERRKSFLPSRLEGSKFYSPYFASRREMRSNSGGKTWQGWFKNLLARQFIWIFFFGCFARLLFWALSIFLGLRREEDDAITVFFYKKSTCEF